jgi:hypothetical protein
MFGDRRHTTFGAVDSTPAPAVVPSINALVDCLGASFARLPEIVQRAHRGTVRLSGKAKVERGGGLGGLIALAMRLPKSNPAADLTVDAWHFDDHMIWSRDFDGRVMESTFRKDEDFLVEKIGLISLYMEPTVEDSRLYYRLAGTYLGPIALPAALAPTMIAWEGERDGQYAFEVDVVLPIVGRVIRYSGSLDVQVLATS